MSAAPDTEAVTPPPAVPLEDAPRHDRFLVEGPEANLWYEHRSDRLLLTFDNLATVDDPYPRHPWMHTRAEALGYSILGVQTFKKDWYRQQTAPDRLRALGRIGFFDRFEKVLMIGASMGGFAALNFAPLVPGARVLAFSPQSSMSKAVTPFENRFQWPVRRTNWEDMPFRDAAAAIPYLNEVVMLYDPFVPEDRQHAARMRAPHVQQLKCNHFSHQLIRYVVKCGALEPLIEEVMETGRASLSFWKNLRTRKQMRAWRRTFTEDLARSAHDRMTLRVCELFLAEQDYLFAHRARDEVLARQQATGAASAAET